MLLVGRYLLAALQKSYLRVQGERRQADARRCPLHKGREPAEGASEPSLGEPVAPALSGGGVSPSLHVQHASFHEIVHDLVGRPEAAEAAAGESQEEAAALERLDLGLAPAWP